MAVGLIDPGLAYFEALAEGEGQAHLMKAQADAARRARHSAGQGELHGAVG